MGVILTGCFKSHDNTLIRILETLEPKHSLYRNQAIAYLTEEKFGRTIILPPRLHLLACLALLLIFVACLLLLLTQSFSHKTKVTGQIINPKQIVTINHIEPRGIVSDVLVRNGDRVEKGQALVRVKRTEALLQGEQLKLDLIEDAQSQITDINTRKQQLDIQDEQKLRLLTKQIEIAQQSYALGELNKLGVAKQITLLSSQIDSQQTLIEKNMLSQSQVVGAKQQLLEYQMRHRTLQQAQIQLQQSIANVTQQIEDLKISSHKRSQESTQAVSRLKLDIAHLKLNHEYTIKAPKAGLISSLQVQEGSDLSKLKTLLKLVGDAQAFTAKVYIPADAIGLIKTQQDVVLRLDAFPYQQFGTIKGKLVQISDSILMPGESSTIPYQDSVPIFEGIIALNQQYIDVKGKPVSFMHGMSFEASITLSDRTLIEWILAPIYRLKGAI